jgi:hypothetical protein
VLVVRVFLDFRFKEVVENPIILGTPPPRGSIPRRRRRVIGSRPILERFPDLTHMPSTS